MRHILSLFVVAAVATATSASAAGQAKAQPQKAPPGAAAKAASAALTAEQVLDKSVEAMGGKAALTAKTSMVVKGTLELVGMGLSGSLEVISKAPNKHLESATIAPIGVLRQGYDGTTGWASDPISGTRVLSGVELGALKRTARFNSDATWRETWKSVELVEKRKDGEQEVYVLKLTPKDGEGGPVTTVYDAKTFLPISSQSVSETAQGTFPVSSRITEYRTVDGIVVPVAMEQTLPTGTLKVTISSVEFNVPVDDARFAKP